MRTKKVKLNTVKSGYKRTFNKRLEIAESDRRIVRPVRYVFRNNFYHHHNFPINTFQTDKAETNIGSKLEILRVFYMTKMYELSKDV